MTSTNETKRTTANIKPKTAPVKLTTEQKEIKEKLDLLRSTVVVIEQLKKEKLITENRYMRLTAGISTLIYELEQAFHLKDTKPFITSVFSVREMVMVSKVSSVDKNDIKVKDFVDKEVNLFRQFIDYMYKEGKTKSNVENVLKLIAAQDKTDIKIEKKKG